MRLGEQPDTPSGRTIKAFQHGAGGAFAVGAGNVDEAEFFLWIAGQRRQFAGALQPEVRAEQLQAVKKLDGFGVGHAESEYELDGDFFRQPTFSFPRTIVPPRHVLFDAPDHGLQFNFRRARGKTGCRGNSSASDDGASRNTSFASK